MSLVAPLPLPADVRHTVVAGLAALDLGDPVRGSVLLVPGYTGSKEDFRLVLEPLAAAGYRAVAVDLPGQYESPGPDDPAAYTTDALGRAVLAVVEALDAPVHLVGHSFGGLVCRAAVLDRPAAVQTLTLMCSGPSALTGPRVDALAFLRPLLEQGGMEAVIDAMEAVADLDPKRPPVTAEIRAFLRTRFLSSSRTGLEAMADALTSEPDRVDALRDTGLPLLVLYGADDDAWLPEVQAEMAGRLGAAHAVVPSALHSPAVENPGATARAMLEFLAQDS